ncbi:MAG TPA: ABC transporter permease [Limnochordia bacterium]|jgi:simple sugar transport system permease protein|nr:ABC transporter permease [Limnochordia bacterium]
MRLIRELRQDSKLFVLVVVGIFTAILLGILIGDKLYTPRSLMSMAYQIPEFALIAVGMALAFLTGGIDLSLVANANTSGIFAAMVLKGRWFPGLSEGAAILVAILVALVSSMLFGLLNGVIIGKLSAQPMIVTLASMLFISGIGMALTSGNAIVGFPDAFTNIGTAHLFGVPVIFIFSMIVILLFGKALSSTSTGRRLYLYGENKTAARFSGFKVERLAMLVYTLTGLFAGLSSIMIISRVNSAKVGYGEAYLLKALLVCMIGGINPDGGEGKISGVLITILIIQLLTDSLTIWELSPYSKKLIWGAMLLVIMFLNHLYNRYRQKRQLERTVKGVS